MPRSTPHVGLGVGARWAIFATLSLGTHALIAAACFSSSVNHPTGGKVLGGSSAPVLLMTSPSRPAKISPAKDDTPKQVSEATAPSLPTLSSPRVNRSDAQRSTTPSPGVQSADASTNGPAQPREQFSLGLDAPTDASPASAAAATGQVSFLGLQADAELASSVVYVVDTSGPMVSSLPWVMHELRSSVEGLIATQQFNVVCFSERASGTGGGAVRTLFSQPRDATDARKDDLARFVTGVEASGRSVPLEGLRAALSQRPRVIFLLCRPIARTASGTWDRGTGAVLDELARLNPIDPATGQRQTIIKVVQFLSEDSTGLLSEIAKAHGGEASTSLRTITHAELGKGRSAAPTTTPQSANDHAVKPKNSPTNTPPTLGVR